MNKLLIIVLLLAVNCLCQNNEQNQGGNLNSIQPTIVPLVQSTPSVQPVKVQQIHLNNNNQDHLKAAQQQQQRKRAQQNANRARQLAIQAQRQAQIQSRQRMARQEQQLKKFKLDGQLSETQLKKTNQNKIFKAQSHRVQNGTRFNQFLFQQHAGLTQFILNVPVAQQVAIYFYTYVAEDNTYIRTKNIHQQSPVQIYIYQNDQSIVFQGQFFFQIYSIFQGKQGGKYLIRFFNHGSTKLISMNTNKIVQKGKIQSKLNKQDNKHAIKTQTLAHQVNNWFQTFRKNNMLDFHDLKLTQNYIRKYYFWEIFETIILVIVCGVQMKLIQNMLKGSSIV